MAQSVTVQGASYADVPAVVLPKTGGGTASFTDVSDTTAAAGDVASGKYFYTAAGVKTEGTASGGGGGNEDAILDGSIENLTNSTVTSLRNNIFRDAVNLKTVSLPSVTVVGDSAFYNARNIRTVNMPNVVTFSGGSNFYGNKRLLRASFPNLVITGNIGYVCRGDAALATVDYGTGVEKLGTQAFSETHTLSELVLRRTSGIVALQGTNTFETNHMSFVLMKTGHVYVPKTLISSYQSDTNWATFYAANSNLFRGLEDYTVDGTTTGALNYSKIWTAHTPDYSITNESFNADHVIDTGIQLFDGGNSEFTIVFSASGVDGVPSGGKMFSCTDSSGYGVHWAKNANYSSSAIVRFSPSALDGDSFVSYGSTNYIGFIYSSGLNAFTMAFMSNGDTTSAGNSIAFRRTGTIQTLSETLLLGGERVNGVVTPNWKGTINWLKVYKSCLNYNEIIDLLGLED